MSFLDALNPLDSTSLGDVLLNPFEDLFGDIKNLLIIAGLVIAVIFYGS